jgi:hypothetical protein
MVPASFAIKTFLLDHSSHKDKAHTALRVNLSLTNILRNE